MVKMRTEIVDRLVEDLVGPRFDGELLTSRPTDTYLTGILWPPAARATSEDDEDDAKSAVDDTSEADVGTPTLGQAKPSSFGLSFAIAGNGPKTASVSFAYGKYSPVTESEGKSAKRTVWQHTSERIEVSLDLEIGVKRFGTTSPSGTQVFEFVSRVKQGPDESLLATISISNRSQPDGNSRDGIEASAVFQTVMEIASVNGLKFVPRPSPKSLSDTEKQNQRLLYRSAVEYATGHQASPALRLENGVVNSILTTWLPQKVVPAFSEIGDPEFFGELVQSRRLSAKYLATKERAEVIGALVALQSGYKDWIEHQKSKLESLPKDLQLAATSNLSTCEAAEERISKGINLLNTDPLAFKAFQLSNAAIQRQFEWKSKSKDKEIAWRPFQLAFILLSIESVLNPDSKDRGIFDLLWFPTGGGKTEAYLAIIGIAAWYQRLSNPHEAFANLAMMRYTLRLLTAQQFSRAAALLLACELQRNSDLFSNESRPISEFSIGFWVGRDASPNDFKEARAALNDAFKPSPIQIEKCFDCDRKLDWTVVANLGAVRPSCSNENCDLGRKFGTWPVMTVDDDIYNARPTLLIGTVDKFAQVPLNAQTKRLFGLGEAQRTSLVIQDELHLISGPLGTIVGLYEGAFDYLLSSDGKPPKIIGSTATIRRAEDQVAAVFDRASFQFPPSGLDADNSGFAVVDLSKPGRLYVGITSAGRSPKFAIQAVAGSLMQSASRRDGIDDVARDGYATLLMYYQSLRELGGALVQVLDDVPDSIGIYAIARKETPRKISEPQELTSRVSQKEIVSMLKALDKKCSEPESIDAVLATNMVSVGLDISRLGLMLLQGQPKSRSEYIQATSRVGRSDYPGLVVTVLNASKTRDQSAYESFENWHSAIYRDVEPASATPYAPRAQERAIHVALTTMLRFSFSDLIQRPDIHSVEHSEVERVKNALLERCARVTGANSLESQHALEYLDEYLDYWFRKSPGSYKNDSNVEDALLQSAEELARKMAAGEMVYDVYSVPNSMRTVEPNSKVRITDYVSRSVGGFRGTKEGPSSGE